MARTAKKIEYVVPFGAWIRKCKARAPIADLVTTIRSDKRVTDATVLKNAAKKYGSSSDFAILAKRYEDYNKRLSA